MLRNLNGIKKKNLLKKPKEKFIYIHRVENHIINEKNISKYSLLGALNPILTSPPTDRIKKKNDATVAIHKPERFC